MRVGGSVWELKIDPKRLREEIKNDIEKRTWKIYEKEHQEANIRFNIEVSDLKRTWRRCPAECAGPLGRIIEKVRRDKR